MKWKKCLTPAVLWQKWRKYLVFIAILYGNIYRKRDFVQKMQKFPHFKNLNLKL